MNKAHISELRKHVQLRGMKPSGNRLFLVRSIIHSMRSRVKVGGGGQDGGHMGCNLQDAVPRGAMRIVPSLLFPLLGSPFSAWPCQAEWERGGKEGYRSGAQ
eukprot:3181604-Karenia_brevis.AAC.1